ncbi:MAG TPA: YkgJ family cysteine cluster protein, partial [Chitinivibrionales bacterium]
ADNIRFQHADLLKNNSPHPAGACAFLDEQGACRIYKARPYVCRTQGLPLHWLEQTEAGQTVAMRDICPLNETQITLEQLPDELCWHIGPFEEKLALLQYALEKNSMKRVQLRDLFGRGEGYNEKGG